MATQVRERALVIDDNPAGLLPVSCLLQNQGFDVDEADGPHAAIAAMDKRRFDLVVSDINMPGDLSGIQLAQILRRKHAELPIILMTGYKENVGAGEFIILAKSFESRELKAALKARNETN